MKLGACIDTLYTELPFEARFCAAKKAGFDCVEFWDWRAIDLEKTRRYAQEADIPISGFNGDADYSLVDPAHKEAYLAALRQSLEAAVFLGAPSVTIHSNALGEGGAVVNSYEALSDTLKLCAMFDTLKQAVKLAEAYDVLLNLEALNTHVDHRGNFLTSTRMGAELVRLIGSHKLRLLYDVYHMQINEGDISGNIRAYLDCIGHVHIADTPGRHEPGTGEINYMYVCRLLYQLGYRGVIGCELFPKTDTPSAVAAIFDMKRRAMG